MNEAIRRMAGSMPEPRGAHNSARYPEGRAQLRVVRRGASPIG